MGDQRLSDRSAPGTPLCGQACVWHKTCAGLWGKIHAVRGAADGPGPADAKGMIASDFNTKEMAALFGILPKAVNRHRATVMPQRPGHGRVQLAGPALKAQQGHLRSGPGRAAPHPARLWTMRQLLFGLPCVVMLAMGDTRADAQGAEPPQQALPSDTRAGHCTAVTAQSSACDAIRARPILDAASPPWSAIGRVNFASIQTRTHCTGVLISEDRVLTAAHCLYNAHRKIWIPVTSLKFVAGYQRGKALATSDVARVILDPVPPPQGAGVFGLPPLGLGHSCSDTPHWPQYGPCRHTPLGRGARRGARGHLCRIRGAAPPCFDPCTRLRRHGQHTGAFGEPMRRDARRFRCSPDFPRPRQNPGPRRPVRNPKPWQNVGVGFCSHPPSAAHKGRSRRIAQIICCAPDLRKRDVDCVRRTRISAWRSTVVAN